MVLVCPFGSGEGAESKVWKEVFREIDLEAVNRGVGDGRQLKPPVSWGRREKGLVPFISSGSPISRC